MRLVGIAMRKRQVGQAARSALAKLLHSTLELADPRKQFRRNADGLPEFALETTFRNPKFSLKLTQGQATATAHQPLGRLERFRIQFRRVGRNTLAQVLSQHPDLP